MNKSFAAVPVTDAGVDTVQFLKASEGLVGMFGSGRPTLNPSSKLMKFPRFTWIGSILTRCGRFNGQHHGKSLFWTQRQCWIHVQPLQKIRTRYDATPSVSATLESLVENEKPEKKRVATEGLLWLLRGLSFTHKALQFSQDNKSKELVDAFQDSYGKTLKPYHGIIVKGVFSVTFPESFFEPLLTWRYCCTGCVESLSLSRWLLQEACHWSRWRTFGQWWEA